MQTFEDYLMEQLQKPVILKDGSKAVDADGNVLTKEQAIATNLLNLAMKGDTRAIMYIENIKQMRKHKKQR